MQQRIIQHRETRQWFAVSIFCFVSATLVVHLAVHFGQTFVELRPHEWQNRQGIYQNSRASWDGAWYQEIAENGYFLKQGEPSNTVFFSVYPLLSALVSWATGLRTSDGMVFLSNICLLAFCILLVFYLQHRDCGLQTCHPLRTPPVSAGASSAAPEARDQNWWQWVFLLYAFWPPGLFFRMGYSESLFLLLVLLAMYGMAVGWRLSIVALIIGAATATRSVGVAVLLPFVWLIWRESSGRWSTFLVRMLWGLPLASWGLIAFCTFLWFQFNEPFAFATSQQHWVIRSPTATEQLFALLRLEPFWGAFVPSNPAFWQNADPDSPPLFSLRLADPLYFALAIFLSGIGWWKRWLTSDEIWLSIGILGIPLVLHAYPACMQSHARYSSVAFPAMIVAARIVSRLPVALRNLVLAMLACQLTAYATLFGMWYPIF